MGTREAADLDVERAIQELSDPSPAVLSAALRRILLADGRRKDAAASIVALLQDTVRCNLRSDYRSQRGFWNIEEEAWHTLASLGEDASEAVPFILQRIKDDPERGWSMTKSLCGGPLHRKYGLYVVLAAIAPQLALDVCRKRIAACPKNGFLMDQAGDIAFVIGKAAIPVLTEFSGPFTGDRGKQCKLMAARLSKGGPVPVPNWDGCPALPDLSKEYSVPWWES